MDAVRVLAKHSALALAQSCLCKYQLYMDDLTVASRVATLRQLPVLPVGPGALPRKLGTTEYGPLSLSPSLSLSL